MVNTFCFNALQRYKRRRLLFRGTRRRNIEPQTRGQSVLPEGLYRIERKVGRGLAAQGGQLFEDVGHLPHIEAATRLTTLLNRFLDAPWAYTAGSRVANDLGE